MHLDPTRPLFIPTHPRVTTTLRFPSPPGAPEGRGFTEDETKQPGEYLVSWNRGECHLTITPLAGAGPLNLNIPHGGETYVFYFYQVEKQFQALACLRLANDSEAEQLSAGGAVAQRTTHASTPDRPTVRPSSAQTLGLIDKLKLLRATAPGKAQTVLAANLGLDLDTPAEANTNEEDPGLKITISHITHDAMLELVGFALRLKNDSDTAIALDSTRFTIECGECKLQPYMAEAPSILCPGEEAEAFITIANPSLTPLMAKNSWRLQLHPLRAATETTSKVP